ncbi:NiaD, nitrate reductase [Myriangium duriaei CBS 260.36]|uniref:Nitrate reductase n=1 Tax=Myriangium duriaei CBS 260.36 TaxID=1168546 RepID=A0A9P4MJB5_9PEZI|nr:NiaD, nitrate reductase [Myriangium duriaei CBS 260.36]
MATTTVTVEAKSEEALQHHRTSENWPPTPPESIHSEHEKFDAPNFPLPPPSKRPIDVLDADKKTPDGWLARDPRLIRLTGVHPFNVEAPLTELFNEGFLTSPGLFYVRNHGPVPQVGDADIPDWEFSIEGMVETPIKITFRELLSEYDQVTYPVTFVCAGNRRKEQNVVRKTKGFSWGPAGVSTALWTGVPMLEVLKRAKPLRGARYVCMEGADKLPNGYYGTSVKLNWVMDPNRGIMLAHRMNGEMLTPDHGKPLRAVIPGQIGGRSVKWLKKLIVTKEPSDNWYHIYDNRVLPTTVSPEESANNKSWWTDERYAIYDLGPNSAVAFPAHEERLSPAAAPKTYRARGYAYGGGGRRITRCEVTLDKGKTWKLANIDYAEDRYREAGEQMLYGGRLDVEWRETCFCWCFWDIELDVDELKDAKDIFIRCMDESMNVQPRDMYWSVLGMMNNPWYRVTIHNEDNNLRFEHPTQPALMPGGWMERIKKAGGDLTNGYWGESVDGSAPSAPVESTSEEVKMTNDTINREISLEEFQAHNTDEDPWFVVNGEVYDGKPFLEGHPGGASSITSAAGQDSTDEFMAIHSETAKAMMPKYHLGRLSAAALEALANPAADSGPDTSPVFLSPKTWKAAVLAKKISLSPDVRLFTFSLSTATQTLGLPTGQHLMLKLPDAAGASVIRAYTPISEADDEGKVDVLVKVYPVGKDGKLGMTQLIDRMDVGGKIEVKGPVGKFTYLGKGACSVSSAVRSVKRFVMVCGGSGVTPIYQVLRAVLTEESEVQCIVLDGNRNEEDILLRTEMDALVAGSGGRGEVVHSLSAGGEGWKGLRGRVGRKLLDQYAAKEVVCRDGVVEDEVMILICGPPALEESVKKEFGLMGWTENNMLFF